MVLTVQAEGDVDGLLLREALGIGEFGTLELGGSGGVSHVDPAHGLLGVDKVHSGGLLGVDGDGIGSAQRGGLDVLWVGYEKVRMPIYRVLKIDWKTWSLQNKKDLTAHRARQKRTKDQQKLFISYRSWPCRNGCLVEAGSPPHSCRCRSHPCLCMSDCKSRTLHTR